MGIEFYKVMQPVPGLEKEGRRQWQGNSSGMPKAVTWGCHKGPFAGFKGSGEFQEHSPIRLLIFVANIY